MERRSASMADTVKHANMAVADRKAVVMMLGSMWSRASMSGPTERPCTNPNPRSMAYLEDGTQRAAPAAPVGDESSTRE